jgi:uncharacterized phage-associated protein
MYKAEVIANFFIQKGIEEGQPISNLKLQKLIYFAHAWYLTLTDQPLIDSTIEAWKFGPVINSVYHQVKRFGINGISAPISFPNDDSVLISSNDLKFLNSIWSLYKGFTPLKLAEFTHEAGSPWSDIVKENGGINSLRRGVDIPDQVISRYFKALKDAADRQPN